MFELSFEVPTRDGVVLRGLHYAPEGGPAPVVLTLTPYGADRIHPDGKFFAERGFHYVSLDLRGRGDSDGEFVPFVHDGADGHDVVEWLSAQPWCDGSVVMCGGSYCGFAQWATAATAPTGLRAIAPAASVYPGVDFPMVGNVPLTFSARWLTLTAGRRMNNGPFADVALWQESMLRVIAEKRPFRDLDLVAVGRRLPVFQEWLDHPELDDYWAAFVPSRQQYERITMPVLTVTGQYDDDQLGALTYHDEHIAAAGAENHQVVIGPWDHSGTRTSALSFGGLTFSEESVVDLRDLHAGWYDWVLGRASRPAFLADRVVYFHVGEDRWRSAPSLPGGPEELRLSPLASQVGEHRGLSTSAPSETVELVVDPRKATETERDERPDDTYFVDLGPFERGGAGTTVHVTEPLPAQVEVSGRPRASFTLSADVPDFDLQVGIYLLPANGVARQLGDTVFRARYGTSLKKSTPWPAQTAISVDIATFPFISLRTQPGDRLSVVVRPPDRDWQPNYQTGGVAADETVADAVVGTIRLLPGSYVSLPLA